jgi:uncharacterized protein with von Willebrand factor type A (vWA) domain
MLRVVKALTDTELKVFRLAQNLDEHIDKRGGAKLKHAQTPDQDVSPEHMKSVSDVVKASSSQLCLPDVMKQYKIGTNQMQIVDHQKPQSKKQLLYLLIDSSGSMRSEVAPNKFAFLLRRDVAMALTLAVIKKALIEKTVTYARFFAGAPDTLHTAISIEDYVHLTRKLALCNYNGGSTDITGASRTAFNDISEGRKNTKASGTKIGKAEVLLITDAEDNLDEANLKSLQNAVKIHTLEITNGGNRGGRGRAVLRNLSETYIEVDPRTVDMENIAKVVPQQ